MDTNDIINRFRHYPANGLLELADFLNRTCPEGREKSLAFTKLEEVMFWANAAIARKNE